MKKIILLPLTLIMLFSLCACGGSAVKFDKIRSDSPHDEQTEIESGSSAVQFDKITSDSPHGKQTEIESGVIYHVKINPEFEIEADDDLCVIAVNALNDDGESVLVNIDIIGHPVSEALKMITDESKTQGFLTEEKGNTVQIFIDGISKDKEICHICGGCGIVACWECNGTGVLCDECVLCNSTGVIYQDPVPVEEWVSCDVCDGSGCITEPDVNCWACHGSGVCYDCGGTGYYIVTNGGDNSIKYISPGVPETDTCIFCKGTGACANCLGSFCYRCNNEGHGERVGYIKQIKTYPDGIECCDCNGLGYIRCNDSFNGYNWCPCCFGSGIEGTGDPNYREYYPE